MSENTEIQEQALPQDAWYSWNFQATATDPVQVFEFGMPMLELDAANRIAKYLGLDTLPVDSILEHPVVVYEEGLAKDAQDKSAPKVVTTMPTPEPEPQPEPATLPPLDSPDA